MHDRPAAACSSTPLASDSADLQDLRALGAPEPVRDFDEGAATWDVVAHETENEPCHAPRSRLPAGRLNLLICRSFRERMMGLEPTTFCMANASDRSLLFASVRSNWLFAEVSMRASEQDRTRANAEPCHSCQGLRSRCVVACQNQGRCEPAGLTSRSALGRTRRSLNSAALCQLNTEPPVDAHHTHKRLEPS
jgi:hypothetical protein